MRINQNISAMNTYSRLNSANNAKAGSLAKLSSGLRINRAGDDAAGLAISEKMRGQVSGLKQSVRNAQDGISLIQTAEGALTETHSILQRMRELAVQSSNDTNTLDDRKEIQKEMNELIGEIDRVANNTEFNTKTLMNGDFGTNGLKFHIGANSGQNIELKIGSMKTSGLGTDVKNTTPADRFTIKRLAISDTKLEGLYESGNTVYSGTVGAGTALSANSGGVLVQAGADKAITTISNAIQTVSAERSKLGATQNRLDHTINNLTATAENLSEAESRIRDVDMAEEMMSFTKNNILSQAATSMLAQANQMPQSVLQLLQ